MTVILEPAAAVAAGLCLAARTIGKPPGITNRHPRACSWCDWPVDELRRMVDGYNAWAGFSERTRSYERHDARVFAELPPPIQAQQVLEAQGFLDDPHPDLPDVEPAEAVPPPKADAAEEGPAWFRQ